MFPKSLKLKLTLGSAAMALVILVAASMILTRAARDTAIQEARQQARMLSQYCAEALAEPVTARDKLQVHLLARALIRNGVADLTVTSSDGEKLYRAGGGPHAVTSLDAGSPEPFSGGVIASTRLADESLIHVTAPIRFGGQPVGVLELWLSQSDLEEKILAASTFVYPIFAAGFVLILALGAIILHAPFRALGRVAEMARRIGAGDLTARVPEQGDDEVAALCREFNGMVDNLSKARRDVLEQQLQAIEAMVGAVEAKDSYTRGHCVRVRAYTRQILDQKPDLDPRTRRQIEIAALLHDVGKIGVPDPILLKAHALTPEETKIVQTHTIIGERILSRLAALEEIPKWVRHHHERWDGLGYPGGLSGTKIPYASRVIAVADSIDAMLSDRPYRVALTNSEAMAALEQGSGKQFDPDIVTHALSFLERREEASHEVLV